jgi:hypothetical protein
MFLVHRPINCLHYSAPLGHAFRRAATKCVALRYAPFAFLCGSSVILSSGPGRRIDKSWIFIEPKAAEEGNLRPPLRYAALRTVNAHSAVSQPEESVGTRVVREPLADGVDNRHFDYQGVARLKAASTNGVVDFHTGDGISPRVEPMPWRRW